MLENLEEQQTYLQDENALRDATIGKLKNMSGTDHERIFEIQVGIGDKIYSPGYATNKKTAEQLAAQYALEELGASY